MPNRLLVVDDDRTTLTFTSGVLKQAGYEVLTAHGGLEAIEQVDLARPDLVVLDLHMPDLNGYEVCRRLRSKPHLAHLPILMLTGANSLEEKVKGFEVGVDDYLVKPYQAVELQARIKSLLRRTASLYSAETSQLTSKVLALFSLRGGVGVSTVAVNLATSLIQIWQMPTALVDLALTCGQDAVLLNLPLHNTWADLANISPSELEPELIARTLLSHSNNLHLLAAPRSPKQGELISADHISRVIALLKERHHYLVLDLPHDFSETTLAGLQAADQIMVVLAPEMASVFATARAMSLFYELGYSPDTIYLILNWTFLRGGLALDEIETTLKHPINLVIPFAWYAPIEAINTGIPMVVKSPDHPFSVLLEDLAFYMSLEEHKTLQPSTPTPAWKRTTQRLWQRNQRLRLR
jgi:pilus assembly protein CpaE